MSSELIEALRLHAFDDSGEQDLPTHVANIAADALATHAATITQLQAELAEARNQALEDAAQEAEKWFPADSAAKYPTGGIAAAIRAMKS